jgi:hypothetical protein
LTGQSKNSYLKIRSWGLFMTERLVKDKDIFKKTKKSIIILTTLIVK